MIHNDIQSQLGLLIKTSAPPILEVADHAVASPQWTPGQQIPAHVLASLPNGRFQVLVGDQMLDLNLPRNTQPGQTLELTYVTNKPRLTFAMLQESASNSAPQQNRSAPVNLSDAARLVGSLLQPQKTRLESSEFTNRAGANSLASAAASVMNNASSQAATIGRQGFLPTTDPSGGRFDIPVQSRSPTMVLSGPPQDIPLFSQALRAAIVQSGLFYESHQVQWLNGERTLASLRQEPQGQLSPMPHVDDMRRAADLVTRIADSSTSPSPAVDTAEQVSAGNGVHPQSMPLVQQQLHALDTRQVIWQGDVWPGQLMHWEIEEETKRHGSGEDHEASVWKTTLKLVLPEMGAVNARLAFVNGQLQVEVSAEDAAAADRMRTDQARLIDRLSGAGLQVAGLVIHHG